MINVIPCRMKCQICRYLTVSERRADKREADGPNFTEAGQLVELLHRCASVCRITVNQTMASCFITSLLQLCLHLCDAGKQDDEQSSDSFK